MNSMNLKKFKNEFEKEFEKEIAIRHNLFLDIKKNNIEYAIEYAIEKELFSAEYAPMDITLKDAELHGNVKKNNIKQLYLNYYDMDQGFSTEPEKGFLKTQDYPNSIFYIDIEKETTNTLELIPFIIHYKNGQKERLTRITNRKQLLDLREEENKLRLTFKIKGSGAFCIRNIKIIIIELGDFKNGS